MNHHTTFHRPLIASTILALIAFVGTPVRAGIQLHSWAYALNESAEIGYDTGAGLQPGKVSDGGGYSYEPDDLPGHQSFSLSAAISGRSIVSNATVNLFDGTVRAQSDVGGAAGFEEGYSGGEFSDNITFTNGTGQPASVTFNWIVEGSTAASKTTGNQFCRAGYNSNFRVDGPGITAEFNSGATLEGDPNSVNNGATVTNTGWVTASSEPRSGGFGGANNHGTLIIPAGEFTLSFRGLINTGAKGDVPAGANFGSTGKFSMSLPQGVSFSSESGALSAGSRMVNISTRADVLGGDRVAIGGFIVTGNVPKKVIIRGLGPSLANSGVSGVLADPKLELHQADSEDHDVLVAANDNWKQTQAAKIRASGIPPSDPHESAIVATLPPGSYTAILAGKDNSTGIGLIEVYDLAPSADARLANISTRAAVESGDSVLIGGIIGGGNGSQPQVLIRAIGPTLAAAGINDALQNPALELHNAQGELIASNNDWQSDQKAAIKATGLAPKDPREAALLATLLPTNYTAIVRSQNGGSGVGLVEVYHLQP